MEEIVLTSGTGSTALSTFTRMGGRKVDLSPYPAVVAGFARQITFIVDTSVSMTNAPGGFTYVTSTLTLLG